MFLATILFSPIEIYTNCPRNEILLKNIMKFDEFPSKNSSQTIFMTKFNAFSNGSTLTLSIYSLILSKYTTFIRNDNYTMKLLDFSFLMPK